jgi:predicted MFS family arabinose efflux permease
MVFDVCVVLVVLFLPAVGPLLGGVLSQMYGWRSTFICLAVFAGGVVMPLLVLVVSTAADGLVDCAMSCAMWHCVGVTSTYSCAQCMQMGVL